MPKLMRISVAAGLLLLACSFFSPGGATPSARPDPTATGTPDALPTGAGLPAATARPTRFFSPPTQTERAQPTPTRTPTRAAARPSATNFPTAGARRTAPPANPAAPDLLTTVAGIKRQMEIFGGILDIAANGSGSVDCQQVVNVHDGVVNAPNLAVASELAGAYQLYRSGVDNFAAKTRDLYQNCQTFVSGGGSGGIPFQQWGPARQGVNESVDMLRQAIIAAGGTP